MLYIHVPGDGTLLFSHDHFASHVVTVDIELDDLNALKLMCDRLGWEFREGQQTYAWVGTWVDDSPVPPGLFEDKEEHARVVAMNRLDRTLYMQNFLGHCEHAIHFPGHDLELGLVRVAGKLVPVWDWASSLTAVLGYPGSADYVNTLVQEYGVSKAEMIALAQGLQYQIVRQSNGSVCVEVEV